MARFFSRQEWPLIAAGVLAGLLTSAVVLYLFFTGIGGEPPVEVSATEERSGDVGPRRPGDRPTGVIGRREANIAERLAAVEVPIRPLRGPIAITARDVVLNEADGTRFARTELVSGQLSTAALNRGDVLLENVVVQRPVVALREDRRGNWNYEEVFAELLEPGGANGNGEPRPGAPRRLVQLRNVRIVGGQVDVTRPADRLVFQRLEGELPVVSLSQPSIAAPYIRVQRLATVITRPASETVLPLTVADGLVHFPTGRVVFDLETVRVEQTRLADVRGEWNPAQPGYGVTASGRAIAVRFEDIRSLAPDRLPETGTATFAWRVRPLPPDLTEVALSELEMRSGDSHVMGSLVARVGPSGFALRDAELRLDPLQLALIERFAGPLPYGGTLVGRVTGADGDVRFDLNAHLTTPQLPQPFTAALSGRVRLGADGVIIQQVDVGLNRVPLVALRALAPGLPFSGVITGNVSLRGPPNRAPLDIDVRLELGAGVALVEGTVDLTGAVPSYNVTGNLIGIDIQSILEPRVPPVELSGRFALNGTGTDPNTLSARVQLAGRFTGWRTNPRDTINLAATLQGGTAHIESLALRLATLSAGATGDWHFADPVSGAITYRLAVASLEPWGPYLPVIGDTLAAGSLEASGSLRGSLERMHLVGEFEGDRLRVGGWSATAIATNYDVALGEAVPTAVVGLTASNVVTPTAGSYNVARLALRLEPPRLNIELTADRVQGGGVDVLATGQIPLQGERTALLERARIDLDQGRWELMQPSALRWGGADGLTVRNLEFRNVTTAGLMLLDGRLLPLERADARVQLAAFPVGDLQRLLGQNPPRLEGALWAEGSLRGGAAPVLDLDFRVENGSLEQVPLQRLAGALAYQDGAMRLRAQAALDTAGYLEIDAQLPARLILVDSVDFGLRDEGAVTGTLTARRLALAPFAAAIPRVRELRGFLDGTVQLGGTASRPNGSGTLALTEGHVRVPELNQSFSEITGRIGLAESRIVVEDLRLRSDGWAVINGGAVLEDLTTPVFDVDVRLDRFRPIGVEDQTDAAVNGNLSLTGPLDALLLTGAVRVEDGYVVLPQLGGGLERELVDITRPAPVMGQGLETAAGTDWMSNLRIDALRVDVGDNTWFMADEARVQLSGRLTVSKNGNATPIVGTLEGTRGQYALVAGPIVRRFEIVNAQVRFVGNPQPNPSIDFTARRIIMDATGRQVDVDVRITGTLDRPQVQLASQALGALPESELASFLLFGQPSFALGGDFVPGDELLEQTFFGGFAELAALELERSLGGLGLDVVQIRLGSGPFGGVGSPTIVLGRQLARDVFLTVETGISALFGEDETLNSWAARLDWTFDRQSRARLALEPVRLGRSIRGAGRVLPVTPPKQQLLLEVRRRWNW